MKAVLQTLLLCGCVTWAGCRSPTVDANTSPSAVPPASASAATSASVASAASTRPPKLPYDFERGCAGDVDAERPTDEQLAALRRVCAPGLEPAAEAAPSLRLEADRPARSEIVLGAHACVRIGIVSETEGAVLRASLLDPEGRALGETSTSRAPMLAPARGVVCTSTAGTHVVELTSLGAPADARFALWVSGPPAPASSAE